jgi:hypothetical protein
MRIVPAALAGATLLASAAIAQQQPQVTPTIVPEGQAIAKAGIAECGRLVSYLEQTPSARQTVALEQAIRWRQGLDSHACHDAIRRLTGEGTAAQQSEPGIEASSMSPATLPPGEPGQTGAVPSPQKP